MFLGDSRQAIGTFKETVFSLPLPASRSATPRLRFEFVSNSFPNRWVFGLAFCFFCFGLLGVALFGLVGWFCFLSGSLRLVLGGLEVLGFPLREFLVSLFFFEYLLWSKGFQRMMFKKKWKTLPKDVGSTSGKLLDAPRSNSPRSMRTWPFQSGDESSWQNGFKRLWTKQSSWLDR